MRILVVEDNMANRQLMQKLLSPLGHCDEAADGQEGVDAFRAALEQEQFYDLVCIDVMMPNMDGHAALTAMRQLEAEHGIGPEQRAKMLMATAVDSPSSMRAAEAAGSDGYIVKPIRKAPLYEELQRVGLISQDP